MRRARPDLLASIAVFLSAGLALAGESLPRTVDQILGRPALAGAFVGVSVRGLPKGEMLCSRNADKGFRPASVMKLLTTAAALDAFGPDARLATSLRTAARLDHRGRLLGDVYLVGGGDPSLGGRHQDPPASAALVPLADALAASGVKRIEGRLIGAEGLFTGERRGSDWTWEDLVWRYGAEVSALSFNDNCVRLRVTPGERVGDPVVLERDPVSRYYHVVSSVVTGPAAGPQDPAHRFKDLVLERPAGANLIRLRGAIAQDVTTWEGFVAIEDPALFAATVFAELLEARGIEVTGGVVTSTAPPPRETRLLAERVSAPMAELIRVVNKHSENLHAELLLRLLGAKVKGDGSAEAGLAAVGDFLARIGIRSRLAFGLRDGSGLSGANIVTPDGVVELLVAMDHHPFAAAFRDSLAVGGVDGTLKGRLQTTGGRVRAKTGTLDRVNALAGYVTNRHRERFAFAALANNEIDPSTAIAALDELAAALAR